MSFLMGAIDIFESLLGKEYSMKCFRSSLILVFSTVLFFLSACSSEGEANMSFAEVDRALIGTWGNDESALELKKDGTGKLDAEKLIWRTEEDKVYLLLDHDDSGHDGKTDTYKYAVNDGKLTLNLYYETHGEKNYKRTSEPAEDVNPLVGTWEGKSMSGDVLELKEDGSGSDGYKYDLFESDSERTELEWEEKDGYLILNYPYVEIKTEFEVTDSRLTTYDRFYTRKETLSFNRLSNEEKTVDQEKTDAEKNDSTFIGTWSMDGETIELKENGTVVIDKDNVKEEGQWVEEDDILTWTINGESAQYEYKTEDHNLILTPREDLKSMPAVQYKGSKYSNNRRSEGKSPLTRYYWKRIDETADNNYYKERIHFDEDKSGLSGNPDSEPDSPSSFWLWESTANSIKLIKRNGTFVYKYKIKGDALYLTINTVYGVPMTFERVSTNTTN